MYDHPALLGVTVIVAGIMAALSFLNAPAPRTAPPRASRNEPRRTVMTAPRTVTTAATTPTQVATGGPCGGWRPLVASYDGWNPDDVCRVMACESRFDPNARNGRFHGLLQVANGSFDPQQNVAQAHAMWSSRGWKPWACR